MHLSNQHLGLDPDPHHHPRSPVCLLPDAYRFPSLKDNHYLHSSTIIVLVLKCSKNGLTQNSSVSGFFFFYWTLFTRPIDFSLYNLVLNYMHFSSLWHLLQPTSASCLELPEHLSLSWKARELMGSVTGCTSVFNKATTDSVLRGWPLAELVSAAMRQVCCIGTCGAQRDAASALLSGLLLTFEGSQSPVGCFKALLLCLEAESLLSQSPGDK